MKALIAMSAGAALLAFTGAASANQALAQKNACMACHAVDKKIVGPSYKDVAKKYAADKGAHAKLMAKVKAGGKGVWGDVPMPPNPQVKDDDLSKIIDWLLSQK